MLAKVVYLSRLSLDQINGRQFFTAYVDDPESQMHGKKLKCSGFLPLERPELPLILDGELKNSGQDTVFFFNTVSFDGRNDPKKIAAFMRRCGIPCSDEKVAPILAVAVKYNGIFEMSRRTDAEELLIAVPGINATLAISITLKIREIMQEWLVFQKLRFHATDNIVSFTRQISRRFPDDAAERLEKDPYQVQMETGVNFRVIDKMALEAHVEPLSPKRIEALIFDAAKALMSGGNTCITFRQIVARVRGMAQKTGKEIPEPLLRDALSKASFLTVDPEFPDFYYTENLLDAEKTAAQEFIRLQASARPIPFHPEIIRKEEEAAGRPFGQQQMEAFQLLRETGICILNGDPGTGKTTTLRSMLSYLEQVWKLEYNKPLKICVMAPSGRAAQRAKESTGREANTIHKVLRYQPDPVKKYTCRGPEDPLDADIIVIDEVSMMGIEIFAQLLKTIKSGSLLLLVGDPNQLQSVDAGDVLNDLLSSGYTNTCHLTEVFRQSGESRIAVNAKKIIAGNSELQPGKDFKVFETTPTDTADCLRTVVMQHLSKHTSESIQILAPMKGGACGILNANLILEPIFNQEKRSIKIGKYSSGTEKRYKIKDRVIFLANNYRLGYFNGDVGYITDFSKKDITVLVGGDTEIVVPEESWSDMALSFACTIHKSQGSEYENVIIVLQKEAERMLDRNLLYTAVTRAKKTCTIISEPGTINKAIETERIGNRHTNLCARIERLAAAVA